MMKQFTNLFKKPMDKNASASPGAMGGMFKQHSSMINKSSEFESQDTVSNFMRSSLGSPSPLKRKFGNDLVINLETIKDNEPSVLHDSEEEDRTDINSKTPPAVKSEKSNSCSSKSLDSDDEIDSKH